MALLLPGGGVDRGGAVPGREVPAAREAGDVPDVAEQPGGAGGADAVELRAGLLPVVSTSSVSCLFAVLILLSIRRQLGHQLRGEPRGGSCRPRPAAAPWRAAFAPGRRTGTLFAPPGISSTSSRCSRFTVVVRAAPSSSRRSTSSRSATVGSSTAPPADPGCAARPQRSSVRRWRRSCGPARWRTPGPAPTASPARPPRSRRRRPAVAPDAGRRDELSEGALPLTAITAWERPRQVRRL